jgi:UDP-N-acetylglucosamine 2-epimerase (non-hydrolysing)
MVHFFIGTKAQFIKMAPIMVEMNKRGLPFRYIDSCQHADLTRSLREVFGIRDPDIYLSRNTESIASITAAVRWYLGCRLKSITNPDWLKNEVFPGGGICIIHGDTLSTLLGMRMASTAGLKIAHVEAGLRSFNIWNPFPEELIRIRCMKRSDLLFAPSDEAVKNLQRMGHAQKTIKVEGNTVIDALRLVTGKTTSFKMPDGPFALATCHRLETIARKDTLERIVELLNYVAQRMKVLFVVHQPTKKYLKRFGLAESLDPNIEKIKMLGYNEFVALEKASQVILTDGGSIQEECSYLNKPCLILRNATERSDGLGRNAILWKFDNKIAASFLDQQNIGSKIELKNFPHPSAEIVDTLVRLKCIPEDQSFSSSSK